MRPSQVAVILVAVLGCAGFGIGSVNLVTDGGFEKTPEGPISGLPTAFVDGLVRDTPRLSGMGFPVFSRTIAPGLIEKKVRVKNTAEPVRIGGQLIRNGDVVAADNDGVVVVPARDLDRILEKARDIERWEGVVLGAVREGKHIRDARELAGPRP